jgi:glutamate mutase epsilon subunit
MKKLFLLAFFISGCNLGAQNNNTESKKEYEFNQLIKSVKSHQLNFDSVQQKATEKESKIVSQAIQKITTLKEEVKDLKSELISVKVKIDTVYIHDTIRVTEKKSFWGKTKVDTLNR